MYYIIKAQRGKHKTSRKSKIRVATYRQERKIVMKKNVVVYVDEKTALVTKTFKKNACIFGTDEFKLWREYKAMFPDAVMTTKDIKKNPNKHTATKNMTYERMAIYIREQDEAATLMVEFKKQIALSKVQTNPYRCVLAWFIQKFANYDSYKAFFAEEAKKKAQEKDIFTLVKTTATIVDEVADEDDEFDLVSGM